MTDPLPGAEPTPLPAPCSPLPAPDPAPRSPALEEELAMLEAIMRLEERGKARPAPVDPPKDRRRGDTP